MPIDVALWELVQDNKKAVIAELIRQLDISQDSNCPIYTPEGEWSYANLAGCELAKTRWTQVTSRMAREAMAKLIEGGW